ncbi:MAG: exodeoxyribonuclease V subunit gamma [Lachnospiraceae bacterium]|nr:exodeoxyribonuclease V subunit gamma [Lachnospiraceae bacterium]
MALRLWSGPSGSGKTRFLFEYVLSEAEKNRDVNYIVIVPEQFTLATQKQLIRLSKDHGILNVDVLSFARLAYKIFEEVGFKDARGVEIDDMGKNLILRHVAANCEEKLSVFNGKMDRLGYITEIKSVVSEFMQYGIGVDKIDEMIATAESTGRGQLAAKLSDIKILYTEFNAFIDQKYITKEERLTKARRAVLRSNRLKKSVVVFDGYTGFTPVQYDFIETLLQIARDIHVTILTDTRDNITYNTQHDLFYLGFKTAEKLRKIAELNNIPVFNEFEIKEDVPRRFIDDHGVTGDGKVTSAELVHLEKNLFREYSRPYKKANYISSDSKLPTKVVNGDIRVFSALQPIDEVRKVAVTIENLVRKDGLKYKDIAISTGDLEGYAPLIKRVFTEYGIPYFIDKKFPVLLNPFIEFVRALIDIINEDFAYSAVFRYLRSPINDYNTSDIDRFENFVLKHGVKGYKTWTADWTEKYRRYYKKGTENGDNQVDEQLVFINEIREKVVSDLSDIINLITGEDGKTDKKPTKAVNEINSVFIRVFDKHNLKKRIIHLYEEYSITDDSFKNNSKKEYEKIYESVEKLFLRMSELLGEEKITSKEYGELLDAGFDEIRIGMIPTITDYIQIGDTTRSRFENIHTLFIVGANDGVIPKSSSSGGIISDIEKEFLIEKTPDIELAPTIREQAYTGQLYLYMLMTKPTSSLIISYARLSSDSDSLRPSYIIKVVTDMFPHIKIERDFDDSLDRVFNAVSLYDVLVENIKDPEFEDLFSLLSSDDTNGHALRDNLLRAVDACYSEGVLKGRDAISKSVASILYGQAIIGSVTRLEQYAKCSLSYFLEYGLSLKEREVFSFEARDMGTVFHAVMEKYAKYIIEDNASWTDINEEQASEYVRRAIIECTNDGNYSILQSSARHQYMIERISRISLRSIKVLTNHLRAGLFAPEGAEIRFSSINNLDALTFKLSEDEIMRFSGSIDRLDTYSDDEHVYIKIIDYKSGDKSFNLIEVFKGISLQLVVYLNAAKELIGKNPSYEGKDIIPAGILYYHIDDPIVEGDISESDDTIADKISKELKMRGLVNADESVYRLIDRDFETSSDIIPVGTVKGGELSKRSNAVSTEGFDTISKYVNKKIEDIGREILSGNIKAEPHSAKGVDTKNCAYCPYTDICKFSGEYDGNEADEDVSKENVLAKMAEAIAEDIDTEGPDENATTYESAGNAGEDD